MEPLFQGREIQETQIDGLFDLVDQLVRQEDHRDVGLDDLDFCYLLWIGFGS